jgi:pimeloyl-ACP methyl ester carboxylesterase
MPRVLFFILICVFGTTPAYSQANKIDYGNNSSAGHYAYINGINLYYEIYGNGFPLLMLHGNGGSINAFTNQIPFFEKHFKVIAIDSRLQGKSGGSPDTISYNLMASDFCELLNYLKIDSAYVLGWSDGGINGLIMAMQCPEKIKMLAVSGANVVPDSSAVPYSDILWIKNFVEHSTTASKTEIALNKMLLFEPNLSDEELGQIHCPVLVMAGDHDIIKPEHTIKIFKSLPNASLCIFPDSNHDIPQQRPELFNETVMRFLTGENK